MKYAISKAFQQALKNFMGKQDDNFGRIQLALLKIGTDIHSNGLNYEKVGSFYSFRVNSDIRIIADKTEDQLTFVYVDHHEKAYSWCDRNKPVKASGSYIGFSDADGFASNEPLSPESNHKYDYLSKYGIDSNFIEVLNKSRPDTIGSIIAYLAPEYKELILGGGDSAATIESGYVSDVLVINDDEALNEAMSLTFEDWKAFLHPKQKGVVSNSFCENVLIDGGPGTGKTVALVWRYVRAKRMFPHLRLSFLIAHNATKQVILEMVGKIDGNLNPDFIMLDDYLPNWESTGRDSFKNELKKIDYILIDEGQDVSQGILKIVNEFLKWTICIDSFQSVHHFGYKQVKKRSLFLYESADKVFNLTYSYRCTEEISKKALSVLKSSFHSDIPATQFLLEQEKKLICPLVGDEVTTDSVRGIEATINYFDNNIPKNVDKGEFAIICLRKKLCNILKEKFNCVYHVDEVKGREFKFGYVISSFLVNEQGQSIEGSRGRKGAGFDAIAACQRYVGFTRFRDKAKYLKVYFTKPDLDFFLGKL